MVRPYHNILWEEIAYCGCRAMVKTAATAEEKMCLRREYCNHRIEDIASSPYIRALCDIVRTDEDQDGPSCLVFEWMDHNLRPVTAPEFRSNPRLPRAVSAAVLSALRVLKTLNAVHTGSSLYSVHVFNTETIRCQAKQRLCL
jgi:hypothetical protein